MNEIVKPLRIEPAFDDRAAAAPSAPAG